MKMSMRRLAYGFLLFSFLSSQLPSLSAHADDGEDRQIGHILLISIDGMHALDLANFVKNKPASALAQLTKIGVTYTNASSSRPSDSFPGLLSIVTGGSPISTGVFYDDSYDRALSPPGSNCSTVGTEVVYDESIDKNPDLIDGGGGIDPDKLPRDPAKGCTPVFPHSFLRVNTVFEVIKAAHMRTAWSDKHPAYDLVNGPSGHGVDDLFTPEIAANGDATTSLPAVLAYDDIKVQAIINEIDGKDHTGTMSEPVPAIFGMNFQAISVGQKLAGGGYADGSGAPGALLSQALSHTDQSIGKMIDELRSRGLLSSTLIVITAKHGQAPIDPAKRHIIDSHLIPNIITGAGIIVAQATQDDIALIWLTDQSKTAAAVSALAANQPAAGIQEILSGEGLKLIFNDPLKDSRVPDIVVEPNLGVIYTKPTATKIAEHGGFSDQDTNVALLVASPSLTPGVVKTPVHTTQIAPTILEALHLDAQSLDAVRIEHTNALPGLHRLEGDQ